LRRIGGACHDGQQLEKQLLEHSVDILGKQHQQHQQAKRFESEREHRYSELTHKTWTLTGLRKHRTA
jgi:hypothetical protein